MGNCCSRPSTEPKDQSTSTQSKTGMSVEGQPEKNQTLAGLVERERIKTELASLREEEASLPGREEALKKNLSEVSKGNVSKVAEIRKLTSRIARLTREMARNAQGDGKETNEEDDGGEDSRAMFPEEIWVKFFDKLTDSQDLWNCYSTCSLFQRILHPWKSTWAFEQALPYLFPYIYGWDLLKCRLVSKGWKDGLDNFLQEHPSHHPHDESTSNPRLLTFVNPMIEKRLDRRSKFIFDERSISNPLDFEDLEWSSKTHQCLALWRTARLEVESFDFEEDDQDRKSQELWRDVYKFLQIFGEHIHFLYFRPTGGVGSASLWTKQKLFRFLVSDLFEMAPNLQKLSIEDVPFIDLETLEMNPEQLPLASRLKTLEVNFEAQDADCIWVVLMWKHHAQLGRLAVQDSACHVLAHLEWPNLKEIHLNVNNLDDLSLLAGAELPNLTKLGLRFKQYIFRDDQETGPWREKDLKCFEFLRVLRELLVATRVTTLRLGWTIHEEKFRDPNEQPSDVSPSTLLIMPPTLKTLEFENKREIFPHPDYQLLLPHFPHLENLNVLHRILWMADVELWPRFALNYFAKPTELQVKEAALVREVVEVNKYVYKGDMYKSNIWEVLPQLEVFTFQFEVYTRGGHEDYCRRKKRSEEKKKIN